VFNLCHVELPELEIQSSLWARLRHCLAQGPRIYLTVHNTE
jgi:hypothetical protein